MSREFVRGRTGRCTDPFRQRQPCFEKMTHLVYRTTSLSGDEALSVFLIDRNRAEAPRLAADHVGVLRSG